MCTLQTALLHPFQHYIGDPYPQVHRLSWWERASHVRDHAFYEANIGGIAQVAAETLDKMPRVSPKKADGDLELRAVGKFLKTVKTYCPKNVCVQRCQRAFLAFKLGVSSLALEKNPEFARFAEKARLDRQLILFDHKIEEGGKGNVSLLFQGKMQPWKVVRDVALAEPPPLRDPLPKLYNPPRKYEKKGVCNENYYNWTELQSLKREKNPSWGNRYLLELCALCSGSLRFLGDHTWIRLKTPEGDIYAPGLYREDNDFLSAFSVKRGALQDHDISEGWDEKIYTVSFEIDAAKFLRVKRQVEEDHRSGNLSFHIVDKNCTAYALGLAELAGIHITGKESVVDHFVHKKVHAAAVALRNQLPTPLQWLAEKAWKVDRALCSVALNAVQTELGGVCVSATLPPEAEVESHMQSPTDLLKPSKLEGRSPYFIAFTLPKALQAAREAEAKRRGVDVQKLQYWAPPSLQCC